MTMYFRSMNVLLSTIGRLCLRAYSTTTSRSCASYLAGRRRLLCVPEIRSVDVIRDESSMVDSYIYILLFQPFGMVFLHLARPNPVCKSAREHCVCVCR